MVSTTTSVDVPKSGKIIHNPELCRGCKICELACSVYHEGICSANTQAATMHALKKTSLCALIVRPVRGI